MPPFPSPNEAAEGFFEEAVVVSKQAAKHAGLFDAYYALAGCYFRLQFSGRALMEAVQPALEHLQVKPNNHSQLTIHLWDSESTNTQMPAPPWSNNDYRERGLVKGFNDRRFATAYNLNYGILSMLDKEAKRAVYWMRDPSDLPSYMSASPLKEILYWWSREQSLQMIHAAAVPTAKGAVLLAGRGGAGKSTTTISCLKYYPSYLGDDYCLIKSNPNPTIYSIYSSAKLNADSVRSMPWLHSLISNPKYTIKKEKAVLQTWRSTQIKNLLSAPVRAIVLPQITTSSNIEVLPISSAKALQVLAPSSLFQLPGVLREDFQLMAKFTSQLPCYELKLSADFCSPYDHLLQLIAD